MKFFTLKAVALALAIAPVSASATILQFDLFGTVHSVNDNANNDLTNLGNITAGDTFSSTLIIDTALVSGGPAGAAFYADSVLNFDLTLDTGSGVLSFDGGLGTVLVQDNGQSLYDRVVASSAISGPMVGGLTATLLQAAIGSYDMTSFAGTDWPGLSTIQSMISGRIDDDNMNFITFSDGSDVRLSYTDAVFSDITPAVPLPAGLPMLVAALGAFGIMRRSR